MTPGQLPDPSCQLPHPALLWVHTCGIWVWVHTCGIWVWPNVLRQVLRRQRYSKLWNHAQICTHARTHAHTHSHARTFTRTHARTLCSAVWSVRQISILFQWKTCCFYEWCVCELVCLWKHRERERGRERKRVVLSMFVLFISIR